MARKWFAPLLAVLLILGSTAVPGIASAEEGKAELDARIDLDAPLMFPHPEYLSGGPALAITGQDPSGRLSWDKDEENSSPVPSLQGAGGAALVPYRSPAAKFSRNVLVSQDRGRLPYQTEPHIAVNPKDPDHVVMATIDYNFPGVVNYVSIDGGANWDGPYQPQTPRGQYTGVGDPVVAFDREGNVYVSQLSISLEDAVVGDQMFSTSVMNIAASTSYDGGYTWEESVIASPGEVYTVDYPVVVEGVQPGGEIWLYYADKEWLAVGPDPDNPEKDVLYITYTLFVAKYRLIYLEVLPFLQLFEELSVIELVRSEDGGKNWSAPVQVSPVTQLMALPARLVQGSQPAVAPDGTLYVAYYDSTEDGFLEETGEIWVAASEDMGVTFHQNERAATFLELDFIPRTSSFRVWGSSFPQLTIGPNEELYTSYAAYPDNDPMDGGDVYVVRSLDGGQNWALPIPVNDDTTRGFQFYSSLTTDPEGTLHMMWGDTRDDPTELAYHIYYSSSEDQGETWEVNSRVTDFATNPNYAFPRGQFIGDYFSIKATSEDVYMVWPDGRLGEVTGMNQKIAFARKRLMPTPSVFLSPPSGPAGRDVTIQGSHFQPESEFFVIMGGVLTSTGRTSKDGTFSITIFAPISGEGTRDIVVSDISGNVAMASFFTEFGFDTFQRAVETIDNRFDPIQQSLDSLKGDPGNPSNLGSEESFPWLIAILAGVLVIALAVLAAFWYRARPVS